MDTFNHVPANDYSSQNTIIIFKSCLELNFCQAGTSLAVDEGCNGFFLSPSPVEECEEGHLSFWKGSLFYKDHNMVCLTRPWPSDYLWCPHYVVHLVWLGEEQERKEGREEELGGASANYSYCYTVRVPTHFCWSNSMISACHTVQCAMSISASSCVSQIPSLVKKLKHDICCLFFYLLYHWYMPFFGKKGMC